MNRKSKKFLEALSEAHRGGVPETPPLPNFVDVRDDEDILPSETARGRPRQETVDGGG